MHHYGKPRASAASSNDSGFGPIWQKPIRFRMSLHYAPRGRPRGCAGSCVQPLGTSMDACPMGLGCSWNTNGNWNRMVKRWQAEERHYQVPQAYWEQLQGTAGKHRPISLLRPTLATSGVECPISDLWSIRGTPRPVHENHSLATRMAETSRGVMWGWQAERRTHTCAGSKRLGTRRHWRHCKICSTP